MIRLNHIKFAALLYIFSLSQQLNHAVASDLRGINYPPSHYYWLNDEWTGDDKPYQSAMHRIDNELSSINPHSFTLQKYHALALNHPRDPLAQFSDAYVLWSCRFENINELLPKRMAEYKQVADEMLNTRDPKTYSFSRIHLFVVLRSEGYSSLDYRFLAFKLLKINPNDIDVKSDIVGYMPYPLIIDRNTLIKFGLDVIKARPYLPSSYSDMAGIYFWQLDSTHSKDDAYMALKYAQAGMKLAKQGDIYSQMGTLQINNIHYKMKLYHLE